MRFNFDEKIDRRGTGALKGDRPLGIDVMPDEVVQLWVADMDLACPPAVAEAVRRAADNRIFGYTSLKYMPRYFRAICDFYRRRFNWHIDSEDIVITAGVVPALRLAVQCLTARGDGVIIQPPVYPPFYGAVRDWNRRIVSNPLIKDEKGYYTIDFEDLERCAAQKDTKMLLFCSPHNPSGRAWSEQELRRLYEICHRNGVIIVSDEIHGDLTRIGVRHIPLQSLYPAAKDIITCTAPSKTFNIAGLERSHIIIPNEKFREAFAPYTGYNTDPITAAAVTAAYEEGDEWLDAVRSYLDDNLDFLQRTLAQRLPRAVMWRPEATYLAWVDLTAYCRDDPALQKALLEHEAAYIQDGTRFGKEGRGFLRINAAGPTKAVKRGVDALADRLDRLRFGDELPALALHAAWEGRTEIKRDGRQKLLVYLPSVNNCFTQLYLAKLTAALEALRAARIECFVITPDSSTALEHCLRREAIPYCLLSDSEGAARRALRVKEAPSLRFLMNEADNSALAVIRKSGMELPDGSDLTRPAAFVCDTLGRVIIASYADTYSSVIQPAQVPAAVAKGGIRT